MHKSKGNAIWFDEAVEKIGADAMRWMYATQNPAFDMRFGYNVARETNRKLLTLWNCFTFFKTYNNISNFKFQISNLNLKSKNLLDRWVLSRLNRLIQEATASLEKFDAMKASNAIEYFWINDLSLWYVRRSRKRFQLPENQKDKEQAEQTFYYVLLTITKLIAPFMPFLAETMYQDLKSGGMPESVHLCDYPKVEKKFIDEQLEKEMQETRNIVSLALAKRAELGIGVRQALKELRIKNKELRIKKEFTELIKDEVNVKEVIFDSKINEEIELDATISDELKEEGITREIVRRIQDLRKKAGLMPSDTNITVNYFSSQKIIEIAQKNKEQILLSTKSNNLKENQAKQGEFLTQQEFKIDDQPVWLGLEKTF